MVDCDLKELSKISFGILSPDEIKKFSVVEIKSSKISFEDPKSLVGSVYDPRLGSITKECELCKLDGISCPGHLGYIELLKPIFNPIFINHIVLILKCFCRNCYKFVLNEDHLKLRNLLHFKGKRRFINILENLKKNNVCIHCNVIQPDYKLNTIDNFQSIYAVYEDSKFDVTPLECLSRFQNINDETIKLLGLDPELNHPKNCIMTKFPVLPTSCRPYVLNDGNICDDDLTYQLIEIVKNNSMVLDPIKGIKHYSNLLFRIQTYFNNTQKKAKHATTGRPIKGIKERIAGKEGQIRNNLLGKRTNQSGRTVIGPDSFIDMETVIVPKQMADILTIPEHVNDLNLLKVYLWLEEGKINYVIKKDGRKINIAMKTSYLLNHGDKIIFPSGKELIVMDTKIKISNDCKIIRNGKEIKLEQNQETTIEIGDIIFRKLTDGDLVMLNRQPTLHKASMMALKVKVLPIKTLKINLAISKPFNCDFDGDEMNIHVPQSIESRLELQELSMSSKCIINSQAGKPNMCIVQDSLTASYLITKFKNRPISKNDLFLILSYVYDGRPFEFSYKFIDIINYILPSRLNINFKDLIISDGYIKYGILSKQFLGNSNNSLIKIIYHQLGTRECVKFVNELQLVCHQWLLIYGFTIHAGDCIRNHKDESILLNCLKEAESFRMSTSHPRIRESKIISCLSKAKDIGMKIAKDSLKMENNFVTTVEAGSKGDYFNIAQITGLLGQQTITNGRIKNVLNNNKRTLPHFPLNTTLSIEDEYKSKGFICNSFEKGLDPLEFFFHAISGRKGVSDTAMSTATSGYNMRRIVKLTEDITIQYDGTIRDVNKRQYQMIYNELGYDPTKMWNGNICDIENIVRNINK